MTTYSFTATGHQNIRATHKSTLEFTKDSNLTTQGDCIIGVNSDFELSKLKQFSGKIKVIISHGDIFDEFTAEINPDFCDDHELVFRMGDFISSRTFGVRSDKGANNLNRDLINAVKCANSKLSIIITTLW